MMSSRAVKIGAGLFAIGWAFRNPGKLLAILIPMGVLQCTFHFFGTDIPEADFPKLVEVLGVVQQPYQTNGGVVIRVRNNAKTWLQPDNIVFVCEYTASNGFLNTHGYAVLDYYRQAGTSFEPGTTKSLAVSTRFSNDMVEVSNCKAGKTAEQAARLHGLRVTYARDDLDKYETSTSQPWRPSNPLPTKYRN